MFSLFVMAFVSLAVAVVLTPFCRDLALHFGLVDHPDSVRKLHKRPIPRIGGVPIIFAYFAACAAVLVLPLNGGKIVSSNLALLWKLSPAVALIFLTGLLDDLYGM